MAFDVFTTTNKQYMVNAYLPSPFFPSIAVYVYGFGYKGSLLQFKKGDLRANSAVFMSRKMFK